MAGSHSRLSPSGAHRYLRCHAAPSAEEGLPNWESIYAFEGTCLHEIAERCLLDGGDPHRFIGEKFISDPAEAEDGKPFEVIISEDHADCMVADLEVVRDLFRRDGEIHVETRGDLTWPLGEGEAGTSDIAGAVRKPNAIHIMDWKFGAGIVVEAFQNEQLQLYAIGSILKHWPQLIDWEAGKPVPKKKYEQFPIHIHILQPRASGGGDHWETNLYDLFKWGYWVEYTVSESVYGDNPEFNPGAKQCQWCRARKGDPQNGIAPCAAYMNMNLEIAQTLLPDLGDYVEIEVPAPPKSTAHGMPIDKAIWIMENAPVFKKWLDEIHERLYKDLSVGRPVPGKKLVAGRKGPRKFKDGTEELVLEILSKYKVEDTHTLAVKSPTQLEKSLGDGVYDLVLDPLVTQSDGKAVIVDEDNPKEAIASATDLLTPLD